MTDMKRNDSENPMHAPECTCTACHYLETDTKEKAYPRGAVLGKADILAKRLSGEIIISPFNPKLVQNASVDVCLGHYYFRQRKSKIDPNFNFINPNSDDPRLKLWGYCMQANTYKAFKDTCLRESGQGNDVEADTYKVVSFPSNIEDDDKVICVSPGETILCHTQEFIGGVKGITTKMYAKSTYGRCGIEVCKCAGLGDIGYYNRWTFEITNNLKTASVLLTVEIPIAQIVFLYVSSYDESDDYYKNGRYQTSPSLENLMENWNALDMLPKKKPYEKLIVNQANYSQ